MPSEPYHHDKHVTLYIGDCHDVTSTLPPSSINAVVTSPPYANQRQAEYGGVPENQYPAWFASRMAELRPALHEDASLAVVIRPHIRNGVLSDYVLRTRLALREDGWYELDEWIWDKLSGPPAGSIARPRRSWEHILWFGVTPRPWCDPQANGRESAQLVPQHGRMYVKGYGGHSTGPPRPGRARGIDIARFSTGHNARGDLYDHPAPYPAPLAAWIIRYVCPPGGVVCDPFMGSGSTGVGAIGEGRRFIGIDVAAEYVEMSRTRLAAVRPTLDCH